MMKKITCILCVLLMVFLVSCKNEDVTGKTTAAQTEVTPNDAIASDAESTEAQTEATTDSQVKPGERNKYSLTNIRRNALSQKQYDAYKVIVNGMDQGKTKISVDLTTEVNSYNKVKSALWSGYPLYALVQEMHYSHNTKTLNVKYSKSGNELSKAIDNFYKKVDSILTKDLLSKESFVKALLLYEYVSGNTPSNDSTLTVYDVIMNGKGTDIQFSMAYEYLLSLAGVECNHVSSEIGDKQIALTQVKLGNNYYYMSPYHEAVENGGKLLKYFGQNNERARIATGAEEFFSINNDYEKVEVPVCNDNTFAFTEFLESWTLDTDKKELSYEMTDNTYTYKY